jgi:sulfofructose kinase
MTYVVCVGAATKDTIFRVPRHPAPDDRVVATDFAVAGGGPAATAAVTLARLGVETYFAGAIGDDDAGAQIRDGLEREGVDVSCLRVVAAARSWQSTILVGDGTRAIVTAPGPAVELDGRTAELCRGAEWVHVDSVGYAAVPREGVRLSIDGGNPIDGLELRGVALYAPTESSQQGSVEDGAELVVLTRGADGCLAVTRDEQIDVPGVATHVVSTLGAGDVFHGALLAALVRELPLRRALEFANEVAAESCRALDGRSAIPRRSPA